jgi:hypothetical protein
MEDGMQVDIMVEMMKMSTIIAATALLDADVEERAPRLFRR